MYLYSPPPPARPSVGQAASPPGCTDKHDSSFDLDTHPRTPSPPCSPTPPGWGAVPPDPPSPSHPAAVCKTAAPATGRRRGAGQHTRAPPQAARATGSFPGAAGCAPKRTRRPATGGGAAWAALGGGREGHGVVANWSCGGGGGGQGWRRGLAKGATHARACAESGGVQGHCAWSAGGRQKWTRFFGG